MAEKMVVQKVVSGPEVKSGVSKTSGKPYTVYNFIVDCTLSGAPKSNVGLSTMSKPGADSIKPGLEIDVEAKEYRGVVSYTYSPPKTGGFGGGGGGGYSRQPDTKYTAEELEKLLEWGVAASAKIFHVDIHSCDPASLAVVQSGAATLLIAAQKAGTKV